MVAPRRVSHTVDKALRCELSRSKISSLSRSHQRCCNLGSKARTSFFSVAISSSGSGNSPPATTPPTGLWFVVWRPKRGVVRFGGVREQLDGCCARHFTLVAAIFTRYSAAWQFVRLGSDETSHIVASERTISHRARVTTTSGY